MLLTVGSMRGLLFLPSGGCVGVWDMSPEQPSGPFRCLKGSQLSLLSPAPMVRMKTVGGVENPELYVRRGIFSSLFAG